MDYTGKTDTQWGKEQLQGAFEGALWAGYYKKILYTDIWVGFGDKPTLPGTHVRYDPYGKVLQKG
ncbi:hypothetical protein ACFU7T_25495 [Streptomyces sp. NPDC057555]|uniref:hypothetical protein n=1 Tax=Streptomyces sp. NPDC057555 TaxID=3346166 RepID=UPI00367E26E6